MVLTRLIAATRNPAKVEQLAGLIGDLATVESLPRGAGGIPDPLENGETFAEIAAEKARYWSNHLRGETIVATDGGLVVPALGDSWNPIRTRRFLRESATDRERADALLRLAHDLRGDARRIGWRESLALARDGDILAVWTVDSPPGFLADDYDLTAIDAGNGFWVPAVWPCPEFANKPLAALTDAERDGRLDHWRLLARRLRRFLTESNL